MDFDLLKKAYSAALAAGKQAIPPHIAPQTSATGIMNVMPTCSDPRIEVTPEVENALSAYQRQSIQYQTITANQNSNENDQAYPPVLLRNIPESTETNSKTETHGGESNLWDSVPLPALVIAPEDVMKNEKHSNEADVDIMQQIYNAPTTNDHVAPLVIEPSPFEETPSAQATLVTGMPRLVARQPPTEISDSVIFDRPQVVLENVEDDEYNSPNFNTSSTVTPINVTPDTPVENMNHLGNKRKAVGDLELTTKKRQVQVNRDGILAPGNLSHTMLPTISIPTTNTSQTSTVGVVNLRKDVATASNVANTNHTVLTSGTTQSAGVAVNAPGKAVPTGPISYVLLNGSMPAFVQQTSAGLLVVPQNTRQPQLQPSQTGINPFSQASAQLPAQSNPTVPQTSQPVTQTTTPRAIMASQQTSQVHMVQTSQNQVQPFSQMIQPPQPQMIQTAQATNIFSHGMQTSQPVSMMRQTTPHAVQTSTSQVHVAQAPHNNIRPFSQRLHSFSQKAQPPPQMIDTAQLTGKLPLRMPTSQPVIRHKASDETQRKTLQPVTLNSDKRQEQVQPLQTFSFSQPSPQLPTQSNPTVPQTSQPSPHLPTQCNVMQTPQPVIRHQTSDKTQRKTIQPVTLDSDKRQAQVQPSQTGVHPLSQPSPQLPTQSNVMQTSQPVIRHQTSDKTQRETSQPVTLDSDTDDNDTNFDDIPTPSPEPVVRVGRPKKKKPRPKPKSAPKTNISDAKKAGKGKKADKKKAKGGKKVGGKGGGGDTASADVMDLTAETDDVITIDEGNDVPIPPAPTPDKVVASENKNKSEKPSVCVLKSVVKHGKCLHFQTVKKMIGGEEMYQCPLCPQISPNETDISDHVGQRHKAMCQVVEISSSDEPYIMVYMYCRMCDFVGIEKAALWAHFLNYHHGSLNRQHCCIEGKCARRAKSYNCTACGFTCDVRQQISNHVMFLHENLVETRFRFAKVHAEFTESEDAYMRMLGNSSPCFICTECLHASISRDAAKRHYRTTHKDNSLLLVCNHCHKWSKNMDTVSAHLEAEHNVIVEGERTCSATMLWKNREFGLFGHTKRVSDTKQMSSKKNISNIASVSGTSSASDVVVLDSDDEDNGGHSVTIGGVASSSMDSSSKKRKHKRGEQCSSVPDKDANTSAIETDDAVAQDNDNESSALPGDDSSQCQSHLVDKSPLTDSLGNALPILHKPRTNRENANGVAEKVKDVTDNASSPQNDPDNSNSAGVTSSNHEESNSATKIAQNKETFIDTTPALNEDRMISGANKDIFTNDASNDAFPLLDDGNNSEPSNIANDTEPEPASYNDAFQHFLSKIW